MAITTSQLQKICTDLVEVLKNQLPDNDPDLVELIGQQYFMGTLSRMISLSKILDEQGSSSPELSRQDLRFNLTYPEDADLAEIEAIRQHAAVLLGKCLDALKNDLFN
ncbi:MAG: hypothetical protein HQM13_08015 [SAR324 cluster bacterium]|nr:hypothetical protein [SAR324 cluster bacterium]